MKKIHSISKVVVTAVLISSMSAAVMPVSTFAATSSSAQFSSNSSSQTIKFGKVTSVSNSKITVALGEVDMPQMNGQAGTPPEMPNGNTQSGQNNTPPEMPPDGFGGQGMQGGMPPQMPDGMAGGQNGTPPQMPGGMPNGQNGTPPQMNNDNISFTSNGESLTISVSGVTITKMGQTASVSDISKGDILTLVYNGNEITEIKIGVDPFGMQGGAPMGQGAPHSSVSVDVTGKYTASGKSLSATSKTLKSTASDVSVVLAENSGKFTLKKCKLYKSGDTSSENGSNFYGLNAVITAEANSTVKVTDSYIESDSEGSNGVFATGTDAKITVKDTTIVTKSNSSRGLDATLGGSVTGTNVKITTSGAHCAALATDRGGGTIKATSSTLNTSGDGSPCIYSTGDITAVKCTGKATGSQIAVVEGKNSITLSNCTLTGAGKDGVMLYQSTSGDAEVGTAVFTATSSKLKTTSTGPMFYVTNTDAVVNLKNTTLSFSSGVLVKASGNNTNNWGTPGKNGGKLEFNAKKQTLKGDIVCDEISSVDLSLKSSSEFTGAIDTENTGDVSLTLDKSSVWNVTADSYVTSLTDSDSTFTNIKSNGNTIYYDATNAANSALNGKTIYLSDGGKITPAT